MLVCAVVSTSNPSSSASPREQLRDLAGTKEAALSVPRAEASSFNLAAVREFVPRAPDTSSSYNVASAKEFQPRGDRSPFNVAKAVEFKPSSQGSFPPSATPTSASSVPSQAQTSPQSTQQSLFSQGKGSFAQSPHLHIPTGPAAQSIPTGPSRGVSHSGGNTDYNARAGNTASMGMSGMSSSSGTTSMQGMAGMAGMTGMPNMATLAAMASMASMASLGIAPTGGDMNLAQMAGVFDTYNMGAPTGPAAGITTSPYNPYATTAQTTGRDGAAYFQGQAPFMTQHQPVRFWPLCLVRPPVPLHPSNQVACRASLLPSRSTSPGSSPSPAHSPRLLPT